MVPCKHLSQGGPEEVFNRASSSGRFAELTNAQRRMMTTLSDGGWHNGKRHGDRDTVTPAVASRLTELGLVERRGKSRATNPGAFGYEYRITLAGREVMT